MTAKRMRGLPHQRQGLETFIAYLDLPPGAVMVEVGSLAGESASIFAASGRFARIYCVDPWERPRPQAVMPLFDEVARQYPIIRKVRKRSKAASLGFDTASLDLVYIDGRHDYPNVRRDINAWLPKVKAGGYIGGHDYVPKFPGVLQAVHEQFGHPEAVFKDNSWLVRL